MIGVSEPIAFLQAIACFSPQFALDHMPTVLKIIKQASGPKQIRLQVKYWK